MFAASIFVEKGTIDDVSKEEFWVTFLASAFRSIRFGIQEAHGKGQAMQLNYILEKGGFEIDADGRYRVNFDRIEQAVSDLTHDILILQGDGVKSKVVDFANKYAKNLPETKRTLDAIEEAGKHLLPFETETELAQRPCLMNHTFNLLGIPIDIRPLYPIDA